MKFSRAQERFLTELRAVRNQAAALIDMADLILDSAEQVEEQSSTRQPGECPHPKAARQPRATMGHPNRFHCTVCDQDVEG